MRRAVMWGRHCGIVLLACACGPVVGVGEDETTSGDGTTTMPSVPEPPPSLVTEHGSETSCPTHEDDPTHSFFIEPDGGSDITECDVWAQDCPAGEKCMPWANDGGSSWNAVRCSPIAEDPREVGEPCTVEGSSVSGIDDCGPASMCWDVDPKTNAGECVAFCDGSQPSPSCADPCMQCTISNEGVLILCLPMCDPLAQDCGEGQACHRIGESFTCVPDAGPEKPMSGEPCGLQLCDPGLYCAEAALLPDCAGENCCTPFCDVGDSDPCNAIESGTTCTPWFELEARPKTCLGTGTVGVCIASK